MNLVLIAVGGAFGAVLRFASSQFIIKLIKNSHFAIFPFNTLFVNVLGSLLAGILYYFMIKNFNDFDPRLKSFLLVGFLGSFTTFSAFSLDFLRLFNANQYFFSLIYVFSSVILSILAIFLGFYLAKVVFG